MKVYSYIVIVLIIIFLTSCFGRDDRLNFVNNSNSSIYVEFSTDSNFISVEKKLKGFLPGERERYESSFISFSEYFEQYKSHRIELIGKNGWIKTVNKSDNKTIFFFIIQDSIVNKYGSKYVIKHNLCERKAYTLEELEKSNWVVTYP